MKKVAKTAFVAMSGGVDSSVAAGLLQKQGYAVIGAHMRCFNIDGCAERDAEDARRVAEQLHIPFYVFDFEKEYRAQVIHYMVKGYREGVTPNPDMMCNKEIKFGLFLKRALELNADYIATGHYVRIRIGDAKTANARELLRTPECRGINAADKGLSFNNGSAEPTLLEEKPLDATPRIAGRGKALHEYNNHSRHSRELVLSSHRLYIAKDKNKDQSYFLWTLTQAQLKHCLFPIGEYTKPQVRALAQKYGLLTAQKKDSQGICFLGKVTLADFLKDYIPAQRGAVITTKGEKIGEHNGAHFYTIGQRHGLKIGGFSKPLYIADKNVENNTVTMAEGENNPALYKKETTLTGVNFINPLPLNAKPYTLNARIRYRQPLAQATLYKLSAKSYKLIFARPQKFVAPGQSAVFYNKRGEMLGGGVITGSEPESHGL